MCDVVQLLVLIMRNFKLSSLCVTLKFMYMFGLNLSFVFFFFELVSILFAIVADLW